MDTRNQNELLCEPCEARRAYEKLTEQELGNLGIVLGAYRSLRGNRRKHISYVSMPITTGKRFYDVLKETGTRSAKELAEKLGKEALWELVIKKNIDEGINFADERGTRKNLLFIAPSVFDAKLWKWTEDAYMSLWYRVMGELAGTHVLMDGWEYSTGGVKEVLFAFLMQWGLIHPDHKDKEFERVFGLKNFHQGLSEDEARKEFEAMQKIRVYDSAFNEIRIDTALEKICDAISKLHAAGFDDFSQNGPCVTLAHLAQSIKNIPEIRGERDRWSMMTMPQRKTPKRKVPYDVNTPTYREVSEQLKTFGYMIQGR